MKQLLTLAVLGASLALATCAQAAITEFNLTGKAGSGLLPGNENGTINGSPGSGGEVGSGISFNDTTRVLTINIGWGSGNGFVNLTGPATAGHIHGPTTSGGSAGFTQNASPKYFLDSLPTWNTSASSGGLLNANVTIDATDVTSLFNGQWYINVHTSMNPGGEIRGQLVPVPEPSTLGLLGLGATGLLLLVRRRLR